MASKIFFTLLIFTYSSMFANAENLEMKIKLNPANFREGALKTLLLERRSVRDFQEKSLNLDDLGGILWAACGKRYDSVTAATRTIPSAGGTRPLELYLVVGDKSVNGLKEGIYRYLIDEHALIPVAKKDARTELALACLGQDFIRQAPVSLVITAYFQRTMQRYGRRGETYVYMETGHACQNVYLTAANLGLGTVEVGAFHDDQVSHILNLDKKCKPLIVMPVGYAK